MRIAILFSYGIFLLGFGLKFLHIPYNAILMMIGIGCLLSTSLFFLFQKDSKWKAFNHVVTSFWMMLLLITIKFYPMVATWTAIGLGAVGTTLIMSIGKVKRELPFVWNSFIALAVAMFFFYQPSDEKYYLFNIKWNYEIEADYRSWDKYAWFLYQNHKYDEASAAAEKAKTIADTYAEDDWINFIQQHQSAIQQKNWLSYRSH